MENISEWIEELKSSGKGIIVEGAKDKRALRELGIMRVTTLSRKPIFQVTEEVAAEYDQVVILTDFDKEGRALYGKLSSGLQHLGVEIDNKFREFLYKEKISHIEGLATYAANKEVNSMGGGCCGGGKKGK